MSELQIGYVNVFVTELERAVAFYEEALGLPLLTRSDGMGYAAFQAGPIRLAVAQTDDVRLVGRHTGVGLVVADIRGAYAELVSRGVTFTMPLTEQPWGRLLALLQDPDGNVFYLDPGEA